jgi:hypothetical protein
MLPSEHPDEIASNGMRACGYWRATLVDITLYELSDSEHFRFKLANSCFVAYRRPNHSTRDAHLVERPVMRNFRIQGRWPAVRVDLLRLQDPLHPRSRPAYRTTRDQGLAVVPKRSTSSAKPTKVLHAVVPKSKLNAVLERLCRHGFLWLEHDGQIISEFKLFSVDCLERRHKCRVAV